MNYKVTGIEGIDIYLNFNGHLKVKLYNYIPY